jgi:hypothetical protein
MRGVSSSSICSNTKLIATITKCDPNTRTKKHAGQQQHESLPKNAAMHTIEQSSKHTHCKIDNTHASLGLLASWWYASRHHVSSAGTTSCRVSAWIRESRDATACARSRTGGKDGVLGDTIAGYLMHAGAQPRGARAHGWRVAPPASAHQREPRARRYGGRAAAPSIMAPAQEHGTEESSQGKTLRRPA